MLKLLLAQLGITMDQATVDKTIADIGTALSNVQAMKESQDRCEAMLVKALSVDTVEPDYPEVNAVPANITIADKVVLGRPAP